MKTNIIYVFIILLFANQSLALIADEIAGLGDLGDSLGITWLLSNATKLSCSSYSYQGSWIKCTAANARILELNLVCTNFGSPTADFSGFNRLQKITFVNCGITNLTSLFGLESLQEVTSLSSSSLSFVYFSSKITIDSLLTKLYLENVYGILPALTTEGTIANYTIKLKPGGALTTDSVQPVIFNPNLIHFELALTSSPTTPFNSSNIFSVCNKLIVFKYKAPSTTVIVFSSFYNAPRTLKEFSLETMLNSVMPTSTQTNWTNIESLSLPNCGLTGTLDIKLLYSPNLRELNINGNQLSYQLSSNFSENSKLYALYSENTLLNGVVPSNILDGGLQFFYVRNTSLNGALPSAFMCCSADALVERSIPPSYLFNSNSFTNYQGPTGPRSCSPVINSIVPNPFSVGSTYITINGKDLGDSFQINLRNSIGQSSSIGCSILQQDKLECINPLLQGSGELTFRLVVSSLPTFKTNFTYAKPVIQSFIPCPTLGGTVTISGQELFRSSNPPGSIVKIYGIECTNINVLEPFEKFTCEYPSGINNGVQIAINVKGLENDPTITPTFSYKAPLVTGSNSIAANVATNLTISGVDFWNDLTLTNVTIGSIECPVLFVSHSIIICQFPATPYSSDYLNINVKVNGQSSSSNQLFKFIDTTYCPNSCSKNGQCSGGLGFCVCNNVFGPSCSEGSKTLIKFPTTGLTSPKLTLKSPLNSTVPLDVLLYSVIENQAETIITSWQSSYDDLNNEWSFDWSFSGKSVNVIIRYNDAAGVDTLFGNVLTYPSSSYSFYVTYTTTQPVASLDFKLNLVSSESCSSSPQFVYATNQKSNAKWLVWVKDIVKYYGRFPMISNLNGEFSQIQSNPLPNESSRNSTKILVSFPDTLIHSASFQFDFQVLQASPTEAITLSDSCLTPSNIISSSESNNESKSNKNAIVGGVVGGIGGLIIIAGAAFIIKQQMSIKKTNSLLDQKLRQLNRTNSVSE